MEIISFFDNNEILYELTSSEIHSRVDQIKTCLRVIKPSNFLIVAIDLNPDSYHFLNIVPCIKACLDLNLPFYCTDPRNQEILWKESVPVSHVLSDRSQTFPLTLQNTKPIYDNLTLSEVKSASNQTTIPKNIIYVVQTSGTTNQSTRKTIYVTKDCIQANVSDFVSHFGSKINAVFVCAPPTFDPFYVDILTALSAKKPLFFASPSVKSRPESLAKYVNGIDDDLLLQMTPTLFKMMESRIQTKRKRIFVLGGEKFPPISLPRSNCEFYNVYGISEMSCWQSMIKVQDYLEQEDIPIYDPKTPLLSETEIKLIDDRGNIVTRDGIIGEIVVSSSTRRCFNDNNDVSGYVEVNTGDLGTYDNVGLLYFRGRNHGSNVVKISGKRVNLYEVERAISRILKNVEIICDFRDNKLIGYVLSDRDIEEFLKILIDSKQIPNHYIPMEWIRIRSERCPITVNGKIDKPAIRYQSISESLKQSWNLFLHKMPESQSNFISEGGDSHLAILFINEFSRISNLNEKNNPGLLDMVLNDKFEDLEAFLSRRQKEEKDSTHGTERKVLAHNDLRTTYSNVDTSHVCFRRGVYYYEPIYYRTKNMKPSIDSESKLEWKWKIDLQKCIDASPLIDISESVVYVGSHSGKFVSCCLKTGKVLWMIELPNRIESSATMSLDRKSIFVGCHDHRLYAMSISDGTISWSFLTDGIIKSSPTCAGQCVIFGSYDQYLYAVHYRDGTLLWKLRITRSSVTSTPAIFREYGVFGSIDGTVAKFNVSNSDVIWKQQLQSASFSSPIIIITENMTITGAANGCLYGLDYTDGTKLWSFSTEDSIFSSVSHNNRGNVAFGSHDGHVYVGRVRRSGFNIVTKISFQSPVFATPFFYSDTIIMGLSIEGRIIVTNISHESATLLDKRLGLKGKMYSSPGLENGIFVFGCRDNYLYGFELCH